MEEAAVRSRSRASTWGARGGQAEAEAEAETEAEAGEVRRRGGGGGGVDEESAEEDLEVEKILEWREHGERPVPRQVEGLLAVAQLVEPYENLLGPSARARRR